MSEGECHLCGAPIEEDDEYCSECGSKLVDEDDNLGRYNEFYDNDE